MHGHMLHTLPTDICRRILWISYAERLSESVLTSRSTSVTAFLLPEQVTLREARSGPNSNLKPYSASAPAASIIRSSCDTAAMCLGLFLRNRQVELESSRIWLASVWTMSRRGQGDLQGKVRNGVKNSDLVIEKQRFYTDDDRNTNRFSSNEKWLSFPTIPHIWMLKLEPDLSLWDTSLYQQGLLKDANRRDVSVEHLTDPVSPRPHSHLVPCLASWKKALMHSPVSIWTEPCRSLTLLPSSIPFASLSITHPLWCHPEWIAIVLLIHTFKRLNGRPDCQTFDFISLCLRKWIILSLIMERNKISVTLKIERSRLWAFPFLSFTIQSESVIVSAFSVCKKKKKKRSAFCWCLGCPDQTHHGTLSLS